MQIRGDNKQEVNIEIKKEQGPYKGFEKAIKDHAGKMNGKKVKVIEADETNIKTLKPNTAIYKEKIVKDTRDETTVILKTKKIQLKEDPVGFQKKQMVKENRIVKMEEDSSIEEEEKTTRSCFPNPFKRKK